MRRSLFHHKKVLQADEMTQPNSNFLNLWLYIFTLPIMLLKRLAILRKLGKEIADTPAIISQSNTRARPHTYIHTIQCISFSTLQQTNRPAVFQFVTDFQVYFLVIWEPTLYDSCSFQFVKVVYMTQYVVSLGEYSVRIWKEMCIFLLLDDVTYWLDPVDGGCCLVQLCSYWFSACWVCQLLLGGVQSPSSGFVHLSWQFCQCLAARAWLPSCSVVITSWRPNPFVIM